MLLFRTEQGHQHVSRQNLEILCNTFSLNQYYYCIWLLLSSDNHFIQKGDACFLLSSGRPIILTNFLIYWRYSLKTAWQKKCVPKNLCKKESSRKSVQNYYLLLEGLQEKIPSFSPNSQSTLFLTDLHQTSKEIQSLAAKEGFGKLSNCSTFGAFSHYPLKQHLVNFFF